MKEVTFIRRNIEKWKEAERVVEQADKLTPDRLTDTCMELIADLAFTQTRYSFSRITIYLNNLTSALHNVLYRNKEERWTRIFTLWIQEVPQTIYYVRKGLLISALIFLASALMDIVSAANGDNFVHLILGNGYVDITLDNTAHGEPIAVYSGSDEVPMFLGITSSNIMVSFNVFVIRLLTSSGTGWLLFNSGVMLEAFRAFFFKHGLLGESMLVAWLHGTLEIWAIIVAGAAGLALGNGWLFPGTYSHKEPFVRGAKKGLKVIVGTVPAFVMAGFIEGLITRHTELPDFLRLSIILLSLASTIYYYIYLPNRKNHGITKT